MSSKTEKMGEMGVSLPCSPGAEVILALHGVGREPKEDSSGDNKCLEDQIHVVEGYYRTQRDGLQESLSERARRINI